MELGAQGSQLQKAGNDDDEKIPTNFEHSQHRIDSNKRNNDDRFQSEKTLSHAVEEPGFTASAQHLQSPHLSPSEQELLDRQVVVPEAKINYFTLFRFASKSDIAILIISATCAIIAGAVLPLMNVLVGSLAQSFGNFYHGGGDSSAFKSDLSYLTLYFIYIAVAEFVTEYIATVGFIYVGEHITASIRAQYLAAVLRQNIAFFDNLGAGEITTRITADMTQLQDGISQKLGLTLTAVATFVAAFVIGFVEYWKLALIMSSAIVAIVLEMSVNSWWAVRNARATVEAYAEGGSIAEEVLSSVRNVVAFGTEEKLARKYEGYLARASKFDLRQKVIVCVSLALLIWAVYLSSGLCFWLGSQYIVSGETTLNTVVTISFSVIMGSFALGNIGPYIQAFNSALAAASKIYATIDRVSPLDPTAHNPRGELEKDSLRGEVELKGIKHIYPSRPEVLVMDDVNLKIPAGKTTALVGASGSGKSTVIGLIERFYDPIGGQVLLDDRDIRELNLRDLRQQISLVQQEPTLFSTTVYDNILQGLVATRYHDSPEEVQRRMVIEAAKQADAHDFITRLPEGYETNVGARGFLMSGGQKQRIAIARAIVSDPKILLLDEATSALDTKSEGVVQRALERASQGRTTVVIAHRLSSIRNADNIVVMAKGCIVEQGSHEDLIAARGVYYGLTEAQEISSAQEQTQDSKKRQFSIDETIPSSTTGDSSSEADNTKDGPNLNNSRDLSKNDEGVSKSSANAATTTYSLLKLLRLILSFNKHETVWMVAGLLWSIVAGGANPTQSAFFAFIIEYLSIPYPFNGLRSNIDFWCWMYFMLAFVALIANSAYGFSFALCSQRLNYRVRSSAFRAMLHQDVAFYDRDENSAGSLTSFLSTEANALSGLSGTTLGTILMTITSLIASIVVGLAFAWRLALVCTACIPIMFVSGVVRFRLLSAFETHAQKAYEASASYACEATAAIRTVASLSREHDVWQHYQLSLAAQQKISLRSILKSTLLYALSQSVMFLIMALAFWYGGTLLAESQISVFSFFVTFSAIVFGSQSASLIFTFAPDMGKARRAAMGLQRLFDREPVINAGTSDGENGKLVEALEGKIEFRNVHFSYPARSKQAVLQGLDLCAYPGQFVALVGASGCGKSTTMALLERFYDPTQGTVLVDGMDIARLDVKSYRERLALVSQEPTLYQGTVRENILLGSASEDDGIPDSRVVQACKDANIYEFIQSLPNGFSTPIGAKGSMLSGGQKQRIAIARALLRDPRILLLDEATSALDSESERIVQAALDKAAVGRTTLAIAHRLSTVQKADMIYVIDQGRVVEKGTHIELLERMGKYAELARAQSLGGQ